MSEQQALSSSTKSRFFYGYIIVLVSLVIMTITFGVNYTFGVFFKPLAAEFGWSKAVTSAAYSISTFFSGLSGVFAGRLTDRFGAKVVAIIGGSFLGLGCILMSLVGNIWQFYFIYGLIVASGIGYCWPSLTATVPRWFVLRRGLMNGIVASGVGFGTIILPPLASRLIPVYGWRTSYIIIGIITLVFIIVAAQFMKRDPHQMGQPPYGVDRIKGEGSVTRARALSFQDMIHSWHFWMVCLIYFFFGVGLHTVMVHIVPYAIETEILPETAASFLATIGGASIAAKLIIGSASEKFGVRSSLAFALILVVVSLLWLQVARGLWMLYLFSFVFGFAYGGTLTLQSLLGAELFGLSSLGLILGSVSFIYTIGAAVGPVLSGYIFDVTGSYRLAFLICAILAAVALTLALTTLPRERNK